MKKSLTRKLTIAVIALVFAVVSLSTSTYAWFTMSNEATIEAFETDVKAGEGIEIAITTGNVVGDAQWYTGNVPTDAIQAVVNPNKTLKFDALSPTSFSYSGISFEDIDQQPVVVSDDVPQGWVQFYVHIKAADTGIIYIDEMNFSSVSKSWTVDAPFTVAANNGVDLAVNSTIEYKVENAARVSICKSDNSYLVFEKDAENYVPAVTGDNPKAAQAGNTEGFGSNTKGALQYYNEKNTAEYVTKATVYNHTQLSSLTDTADSVVRTELSAVTKDVPVTFLVTAWIEGWDAECLNAIFAQTLSVNMMFSFKKSSN